MTKRTKLEAALDKLEEAYAESIRAPEYGEYLKAREAVKALVREMLMEMGERVVLILEPSFPKDEIADHSSYHVDAILNEPEE